MKKFTMSVCVTALTLGGMLAAMLPASAATSVKKSTKPALVALDDSRDGELVRTEGVSTLEPLSVKKASKKSALLKLPSLSRAEQTMETLLDSVVTSENGTSVSKTVYDYDEFGRKILTASLSFSTAKGVWDTLSSTLTRYNEAGYVVLYAVNDWDYLLERPLPMEKTVSVYGTDGDNNLTMVRTDYSWLADSLRWMETNKQEVVFIGQQNSVYQHYINYYYDAARGWIPSNKYEQFENKEGYSLINASYNWVDSLQAWVGSYKSGYLYDDVTDNTILESAFFWSPELNLWSGRTDYTFLEDGRIKSTSNYNFITGTQTWEPIERTVTDYEGDEWFDQLTITQKWDAAKADWINTVKTGGEYDSNIGKTSRFVRYDWDEATGEWKGNTYWSKGWDGAGNLQSEVRYQYTPNKEWAMVYDLWAEYDNLTEGEWLITTWMESEYNFDGYRTSYTQMYRPLSTEPWVSSFTYKQTLQFNGEGLRLQLRTYDWDDTNDVWINAWKRDYTINEAGDYALSVYSQWQVTDWVETSRNTYFYSQKLVGVQAIQVRLDVYPNPVSDRLVIKGAAEGDVILVLDLNGRTMRSLKAAGEETSVNMADVPSGMYLVQVGKQVVKIVK